VRESITERKGNELREGKEREEQTNKQVTR